MNTFIKAWQTGIFYSKAITLTWILFPILFCIFDKIIEKEEINNEIHQ